MMELRGLRAETPEDYHTMQDALYRTLTFQFPTDLVKDPLPSGKAQITSNQLALLLGGVELASVRHRKRYALPEIKK